MRGQPGFFDVDERLKELSAKGDNLERLSAVVDFGRIWSGLCRARTAQKAAGRRLTTY
jgi:transposase, IS5 family